jgi:hypothetical protein
MARTPKAARQYNKADQAEARAKAKDHGSPAHGRAIDNVNAKVKAYDKAYRRATKRGHE